jgi:hypothetical protein
MGDFGIEEVGVEAVDHPGNKDMVVSHTTKIGLPEKQKIACWMGRHYIPTRCLGCGNKDLHA